MFVPNEPAPASLTPSTSEPAVQSDVRPTPLSDKVFLLNRGNRRYLDQRSRRVHLQPADFPLALQLLLLVFAVFMTFVAIQGGYNLARWAFTKASGTITRGYVVEKHISRGKSVSYTVTYSYTVNGQNYRASQQVDSSVYNKAVEVVEVTYWPPNPNMARLSGDFEVGNMFLNSSVQLLCPGVFVIVMAAVIVFCFREWRKVIAKQNRLKEDGKLVYGEIVSCRGINRPKQGYKVTVRYGFRTPDSDARWVVTEQQRTVNWLNGKPLPKKGTPVAVLYADNKTLEML
jgi:hypothetical protein